MSEKAQRIEFSFDDDGTVRAIYDDSLHSLLQKGEVKIKRASHVEPCGDKWMVDLSPIGGPRLKRLYELRDEALQAEVDWIKTNWL
jgi:hypothetical protein